MENGMNRALTAAFALLSLWACAAPAAELPAEGLAADGRDIAEAQCASCHAVGSYGDSPNPAAPTFRTVLSQYNPEVLEEELITGIEVAHPMPAFEFNPVGVDALIAYLRSIQEAQPDQSHR